MAAQKDRSDMMLLCQGEMDGLSRIFDRYKRSLFQFFLSMTGHKQLAEDLVMSTVERLYTYRHSYQPDRNFRAWLFTMARNLAMDHFRLVRREQKMEGEIEAQGDHLYEDELPVDPDDVLNQLLPLLNQEERGLISLYYLADVPYTELSEIYEQSVNALRIRVYRILKKLNQLYNQQQLNHE